jgi:hypothetical protein
MKGTTMSDDERVDVDPAASLFGAMVELRATAPNAWTEGPVADLALRLDRVVTLHHMLAEIQSWLELALAESMEDDDISLRGIGVLHREEQTRSSWKHAHSGEQLREDLAVAVASNVALDVATGEVDPMKRNVALHALRTAYEAIPSFSSLKVAGRKKLGLKISDYRDYSTYYKVTLEVTDEADR